MSFMIVERFKRLGSIPLLQNLSWMLVAEFLSRLSRIVTLFVLAAIFSNEQYGLAMLALLIHELFRVFTRIGTGAKIIQCEAEYLQSTIENAATLQWMVISLVTLSQIILAPYIALFYDMPELDPLLKIMAVAHLFYPLVAIRIFEQHRMNKMRYYGIASGICIAFENLFTALLVFMGVDVIAVAIAKVSAAVFWISLFYRLPSVFGQYRFNLTAQWQIVRFSFATLLSELSRMLRFQSDSLIAARLLSPEHFGLYSFAKNAGLGIAQAFSQAYLSALFPHMCERARATGLAKSQIARRVTLLVCAMFAVQAVLAPWYVTFLFGERWADATMFVSLLCFVAIPTLLVDFNGLQWRAQNSAFKETKAMALSAALLGVTLLAMQPTQIDHLVYSVLGVSLVWLLLISGYTFSQGLADRTTLRVAEA